MNGFPNGRDLPAPDEFDHQAHGWTVGDLRRAIAELPDQTPLEIHVALEPGGSLFDVQVVIGAGFGESVRRPGQDPDPDDAFGLECEFPSGRYLRKGAGR